MEKRRDSSSQPVGTSHHVIVGMEVTGGFLKGAKLEFADGGLNCLIGGRGTGKTTVLELIRYALTEPNDPGRARQSGLLKANLGSGRVKVHVRTRDGVRYTAERMWGETTQFTDEAGEPKQISLDRDLLFHADIYSQNEIEEIAVDPRQQLALLDSLVGDEIRRIDGDLDRIERSLVANASELLRVYGEIEALEEGAQEGTLLEEKLRGLEQAAGPDAKALKAAHSARALREKGKQALALLQEDLRVAKGELESRAAAVVRRLESRLDRDLVEGPDKRVFGAVAERVEKLSKVLEKATSQMVEAAARTGEDLLEETRALSERHLKEEAAYRSLLERSQEESGKAAERAEVEKRFLQVTQNRRELDLNKKTLRGVADARKVLLQQLSDRRDERFEARSRVAESLTSRLAGTVRVSVLQAGNRSAYREMLSEALKRATVTVEAIVKHVRPERLATLVEKKDPAGLAQLAGLEVDRAEKVIQALRGTPLLYQIQVVDLDDLPRIELKDGDGFKESADLSTGQRCTTILPILLLGSERPLLIDQPEDNLDNRFVYEDVVKRLRDLKSRRQLIFVTHNGNVPVCGDAQRVFVMDSDGKRGWVANAGPVNDLKEEIIKLLEGGREAFQRRKDWYGY